MKHCLNILPVHIRLQCRKIFTICLIRQNKHFYFCNCPTEEWQIQHGTNLLRTTRGWTFYKRKNIWIYGIDRLYSRLYYETKLIFSSIFFFSSLVKIPQFILNKYEEKSVITPATLENSQLTPTLLSELFQWGGMILFDYLTGNYDR